MDKALLSTLEHEPLAVSFAKAPRAVLTGDIWMPYPAPPAGLQGWE